MHQQVLQPEATVGIASAWQPWSAALGITILAFCAGSVSGAFLRRLGENWADRLMLSKARRVAEKAEKEFEEFLARLQHQLRHAESTATLAAERRIDAHQAAYRHLVQARDLSNAHSPESLAARDELLTTMKEWHLDNCLYLTSECNKAYIEAYYSLFYIAGTQDDIKSATNREEFALMLQTIKVHRKRLEKGPEQVLKAVRLPAIGVIQPPPQSKNAEPGVEQ